MRVDPKQGSGPKLLIIRQLVSAPIHNVSKVIFNFLLCFFDKTSVHTSTCPKYLPRVRYFWRPDELVFNISELIQVAMMAIL